MTIDSPEELRPDLVVLSRTEPTDKLTAEQAEAINALRFLAADSVEKANSGHPGTAMALAPLAYRLYTQHMRHNPSDPTWFDRDRLVLSVGHVSVLQYSALHLMGYDVSLEDMGRFRQWGSSTPGHPERGFTPGVDVSTGPLGQGVANGAGFAMAEKMLAERFNTPEHQVIDHRTWVIAGDGDMMEGITSEAASLSGRLGIDKLTVFYDDNRITLEGASDREFREDVPQRFDAYGWHVERVPCVNDLEALDNAIAAAIAETERPTLIIVGSTIGYGSPKAGSADAHGSPLGEEALAGARVNLNWNHAPFEIPDSVYAHWQSEFKATGAHDAHQAVLDSYRQAHPDQAAELDRVLAGDFPAGWNTNIPTFEVGESMPGRTAGHVALNHFAEFLPELVGGSADVTPSTKTSIDGSPDINSGDWTGRNIFFGVREHTMGAMCNGMAAHGGIRPFCSTYFVFSDYLRPTIRMAALMELSTIWVFTHDSIGVGQDGPTHQPIEHLASLRAIPGVRVMRPGDANEVIQAWQAALEYQGPTVLVLSRQGMAIQDAANADAASGGSVVAAGDDITLVGTGTEVEVAAAAAALLADDGISAKVVSMTSWELFRQLPKEQRQQIIPGDKPSLSIEAGATQGWLEFVDEAIGIDHFGASAPPAILFEEFGITAAAMADRARSLLA